MSSDPLIKIPEARLGLPTEPRVIRVGIRIVKLLFLLLLLLYVVVTEVTVILRVGGKLGR